MRKETDTGCRGGAVGDGSTYCIERALPVVGDVGLAFRGPVWLGVVILEFLALIF